MTIVRQLAATVLAALREIFDEAAYARFLANHGLEGGRGAYASFLREHGEAKAKRPKCC